MLQLLPISYNCLNPFLIDSRADLGEEKGKIDIIGSMRASPGASCCECISSGREHQENGG